MEPLAVSMPGLKLADRLVVVGCSDPMLIAALGTKVGLTGRTCAVDADAARAEEAGRIAEREGALIETAAAPGWRLPYDGESFDVAVVRSLALDDSAARLVLGEALRVLRPGGRCVTIDGEERRGFAATFGGGRAASAAAAAEGLRLAGFVAVRELAARAGLAFTEGVKKNV
jgi:ubiquinone/menaquinone biosynthesis C-methylase UbiE